ncbi:MAG: hypothetical protein HY788_03745 [Deltaproteobacteria bacterium]|nr:hypothetical protein [Deltaproteobacteria bacterium]
MRLGTLIFLAFLVVVGGAWGYIHFYWGGMTPFLCQFPQVASLLDREKISLKPFIVPSPSAKATYLLVTVEFTVEKGRGLLVSKQLPLLRGTVLNALIQSKELARPRRVRFGGAIASINAKLGEGTIREMWIREVRSI